MQTNSREVRGRLCAMLLCRLFEYADFGDRNNEGHWGNSTVGLSGVDAGAPSEGMYDSGFQHLDQRGDSAWANADSHGLAVAFQ